MTSVAACALHRSMASDALAFEVVIHRTASCNACSGMRSRLHAVVRIPVPSGLVNTSASPGRAPALVTMRAGCTTPVTAMPYFGSGSLIVCPPSTATPASRATKRASFENAGQNREVDVVRKCDDVECG